MLSYFQDSDTAKQLVENLFMSPLMEKRTVILVTHHLELVLPAASYIVHLKDGRIVTQGPVEDLRTTGALIEIEAVKASDETTEGAISKASASEVADGIAEKAPLKAAVPAEEDDTKAERRRLVKDEYRAEGKVKFDVYKEYIRAT